MKNKNLGTKILRTLLLLGWCNLYLFSCQTRRNTVCKGKAVEIIKVYKIPVVGGVNGSSGERIVLGLIKAKGVKLSTIEYSSKISEVSIFKIVDDTVWIESYFYNRVKIVKGSEGKALIKKEDYCTLNYTLDGANKYMLIPSLKLVSDTVLWE